MKNILKEWGIIAASFLVSLATLILVLVGGNQSVPNNVGKNLTTNYDEVAMNDGAIKIETLALDAGEISDVYTNTNPASEWVNLAQLSTTGTASSSFKFYLVASTSASIAAAQNFKDVNLYTGKNLLSGTIASSSSATSTSNVKGAVSVVTLNDPLYTSDGLVEIKTGESVLLFLQRGDSSCPVDATNMKGGCEAATSTNRGFNISVAFQTMSTSTQR